MAHGLHKAGPAVAVGEAVWHASLGAWPERDGTRFRVWAPAVHALEVIGPADTADCTRPLSPLGDGFFGGWHSDIHAGDLYGFFVDGRGPYPDPASRYQPNGVHGFSQVVDPRAFVWSDQEWRGPNRHDLVFYELHVGAFSPAGTFEGVTERLPDLAALGVTAVELMPVADFDGQRNWGYDGVALFAPARCYGTPDDLRRLVDTAHALGLSVIQDVVYNHLGPEGSYLSMFSPYYLSEHHTSPWGRAIDIADEQGAMVREFLIENALHWLNEYHMDGLRLDATHAMIPHALQPFLHDLAGRARRSVEPRHVVLIAEDSRNIADTIRPESAGGWGLDAVWADDLHHELRRKLAGDSDGYFGDYTGAAKDIATTIRQGWFYTGQPSAFLGTSRGTDPSGIPLDRFIVCLQNHDQVGNRAMGDRLHHGIDLAAYRAAILLLLSVPETPLLFMGQEWAAGSPFLYFTDHNPELGRMVTEGRRLEFKGFPQFSNPVSRTGIPDPQAESTFRFSRLNWEERNREPHASILRLHETLLGLRHRRPALHTPSVPQVTAADENTICLYRESGGDDLLAIVRLRGSGTVDLCRPVRGLAAPAGRTDTRHSAPRWICVLTTEDEQFATDPAPPQIDLTGPWPVVHFQRPSGVLLSNVEFPAESGED